MNYHKIGNDMAYVLLSVIKQISIPELHTIYIWIYIALNYIGLHFAVVAQQIVLSWFIQIIDVLLQLDSRSTAVGTVTAVRSCNPSRV